MKHLARVFVAARWAGPDEVAAFLQEVDDVQKTELLKCFEFLCKAWGQIPKATYRLHCLAFVELAKRGAHRSLFAPMSKGVLTPNPFLVEVLEQTLPILNSPKEHKDLVVALGHPDAAVRKAAAALVPLVVQAATLEWIVRLAASRGFEASPEFLELVVVLRRPELLPALEAALPRARPQLQEEIIGLIAEPAMLRIDPLAARDVLLRHTHGDDDRVSATALAGLGAVTDEAAYALVALPFLDHPSLVRVKGALKGFSRHPMPRTFQLFEDKLAEGPTEVRMTIVRLLGEMGGDDVLPPLVAAISLEDLKVQAEAVLVLRKLTAEGEVDVIRTLLWLLRSPQVQLRRLASEVIDALPDPTATTWPRLLDFLRDEDWWVRERVLEALVQVAGKELTRYLAALLQDPSRTLRRLAVEGLAKLADEAAIGVLIRTAQTDDDWWVREASVEAVGKLQDQRAIPHVLALLAKSPDIAVACIDTLRTLHAVEAADTIVEHLQGAADTRLAALRFLATVHRPELASRVQPFLNDSDVETSEAAREVLEAWSVQLFLPPSSDDDAEAILEAYLATLVSNGGDDLIFASGERVFMKQRGAMVPLTEVPLTAENVYLILSAVISARQLEQLSTLTDVDMSHRSPASNTRFRVNVFQAQHGLGAVFRRVSNEVLPFDRLGLPPLVRSFSKWAHGLVLVGGPPGSGKSTTLSSLLRDVNETANHHVITVEDPIEAIHVSQRSLFNQREVGKHTPTFGHALGSILRQDPDVIHIGELRDLETIEFALRAAETGHLVLSTVHTFSADTTVDRLVNTFPPDKQDNARGMLADSLRAVLCQFLLPDRLTGGRVIAAEIMINNDAIANVIRKNQTYQIPSLIQIGRAQGQLSMDQSLASLFREGRIDEDHLKLRLRNKDLFDEIVKGELLNDGEGAGRAGGPD